MTVRNERIKKSADIKKIFQAGKTTTGRFVFLKTQKTKNKNCRLCFVVGLKVSKKAVERNKTKRRIREIVKSVDPCFSPGHDIVIVAQKEILGKKYTEIKDDITETMKKAKIFYQ